MRPPGGLIGGLGRRIAAQEYFQFIALLLSKNKHDFKKKRMDEIMETPTNLKKSRGKLAVLHRGFVNPKYFHPYDTVYLTR